MDIIPQAAGSASFYLGATKAVAWIIGPKEGKGKNDLKGNLKCKFSLAAFSTFIRKKEYKRDLKMREFSKTFKDIFEQSIILENYQKCDIELNVLILESDGNYKGAAINAATLAFISAGILLRDTIVGINVGLFQKSTLTDLLSQEEKNDIPLMNVAYMPHFKKFVYFELLNAKTPYENSDTLMRAAETACNKVFSSVENYLKFEYIKSK
jgi:ribonuclease PH